MPQNQSQGIGSRVMKLIEENPSSLDEESKMMLNGNNGSYEFYSKKGYKIIKEHDFNMNGVIMPIRLMEKLA